MLGCKQGFLAAELDGRVVRPSVYQSKSWYRLPNDSTCPIWLVAPQRWSVNPTVQVLLNHVKTFAVEGLPLEVSEKESSKILGSWVSSLCFLSCMRLVRGCGVLYAASCLLRTIVRVPFLVTIIVCSLPFILKIKIFTRMRHGLVSLLLRTSHKTELKSWL